MRNYSSHSESLKWYYACGIWESYNFQFKTFSLEGDLAVMNEDTFNHKCTREPLQGSSETWRSCKGNQLKEATRYLGSTMHPCERATSWCHHDKQLPVPLTPPWWGEWNYSLSEKLIGTRMLVEGLKFHSNRTESSILGDIRGKCDPCIVH